MELRDGFPKAVDELYRYHAVVLDDIEAGFFTPDQLALLRNFVSQRGGGLLMLGGPDSFADGKYDRTPVGELLPVYLNRPRRGPVEEPSQEYRLVLTREGWLQPWVRMRKTEDEERQRLAAMTSLPHAQSRRQHQAGGRGPCRGDATPPARPSPALVAQQFGKGHVAALLIGDLWRWGMRRENPAESDLDRSWRQTVRWLVGDVPEPGGGLRASQGRVDGARRRSRRPGARRRVSAARQRQGRSSSHSAGRRQPDSRRRARWPRSRHVRGDVCHQAAGGLSGRRDRDRARTAAPSASAKPAGPPSPRPTSSPGWSPTGNS